MTVASLVLCQHMHRLPAGLHGVALACLKEFRCAECAKNSMPCCTHAAAPLLSLG